MEGFDPRTSFGYDESKRYDAVDTRGDEGQTVAFLAQLARQRDALEFAVGTGRIALPYRPPPHGLATSMSTPSTSGSTTSCWTSAGTTP
jgi:hypothetical protein